MTSEVRDLGYQRYVGLRHPARLRWRVIARHVVTDAWRRWWGVKPWLGCAVAITCTWIAVLYQPASILALRLNKGLSYPDVLLAMSVEWYCRIAFMLSLVIGATAIAGDIESGAFTFYFARSVQPRDYVVGKVAGNLALVAALVVAGPVAISLARLGLYDSFGDAAAHAGLVGRALVAGLTIAIPYTAIPLGFSALVNSKRLALALWTTYYAVFGTAAALFARAYGGSLGALDLPTACLSIAFRLFDAHMSNGRRAARSMSLSAAVVSLALHVVIALVIVWVRVGRAQRRGIGGAS